MRWESEKEKGMNKKKEENKRKLEQPEQLEQPKKTKKTSFLASLLTDSDKFRKP